jgi:signal transduction histidine kinase
MARPSPGLAGRLFAAQALVAVAGTATVGLIAIGAGPTIFRDHLQQMPEPVDAETIRHVEDAYASASAVSLTVALIAALATALAVSAYVARRVARPIRQLADAAADMADGRYEARVTPPALGNEFDTVTEAFNAMAARIAATEATRRRLLADLGHELRTPVATIEAYVDAAEDGLAVEDEDTWSVLRGQTTRLRRLTEDLAAISRFEEAHPAVRTRRIATADLVSAAVAAARPHYTAKGVVLDERVGDDAGDLHADPERMAQALGNLLDNALRHTAPGGRVTLDAQRDTDGLRLTVADTGTGIAPEHLPHLFERFYRGDDGRDRDHGGSGIGLAIVRAIVTQHRGTVTATSEGPGTGSAFTITLPTGQRALS